MEEKIELKIISLIEDLQKRMTYLEKKMDILIKQSSEKSLRVNRSSPGSRTGGAQHYNKTGGSRYVAKKPRLGQGPSDGNKQRNEGRVFPKKNQTFKPASKKRSVKPE